MLVSVAAFGELPPVPGPVHLAVGVFDGVHLGHREVLGLALAGAARSGGPAGVLTFSPHPSRLFRPSEPVRMLLPPAVMDGLLASLGLAFVVRHPFDRAFAALPAEEFLPWLKSRLPALAGLYVGENFRFGAGRAGDAALLARMGRELGVHVFAADRIVADGERVSSTRIRGLVAAGDVTEASVLLGYDYFAEGRVEGGRRLGRTIGFPTLNLPWAPELAPAYGVYAVELTGPDGVRRRGVANYGVRPTVEDAPVAPRLEIHLFAPASEVESAGLTEGVFVKAAFLRFLRPERKFSGLDELRAQIAADVEAARA